MLFLELFWTFFKIGLFGFGGGYAMLSMIQGEVVTSHHWLTTSQFADIVAISQSTPGPIGINSATYAGYVSVVNEGYSAAMGVVGSLVATVAVVLPSFLMVLLVLSVLRRYWEHPAVKTVFAALRPTVVGLLLAAVLVLMTKDNFGSPTEDMWQFGISIFLFVTAFVGTQFFKVSPIRMILLCALAGLLLYY
ncbi:MAG: chromate transporter [Bacteroidaceae bacterium]|nr:chromate transporter [Bacteroidaceae bacterium]